MGHSSQVGGSGVRRLLSNRTSPRPASYVHHVHFSSPQSSLFRMMSSSIQSSNMYLRHLLLEVDFEAKRRPPFLRTMMPEQTGTVCRSCSNRRGRSGYWMSSLEGTQTCMASKYKPSNQWNNAIHLIFHHLSYHRDVVQGSPGDSSGHLLSLRNEQFRLLQRPITTPTLILTAVICTAETT